MSGGEDYELLFTASPRLFPVSKKCYWMKQDLMRANRKITAETDGVWLGLPMGSWLPVR